jgi:hypothetical protein
MERDAPPKRPDAFKRESPGIKRRADASFNEQRSDTTCRFCSLLRGLAVGEVGQKRETQYGKQTMTHAMTLPTSKTGTLLQTMDDTGKHDCKGKNSCKGQGGCKGDSNSCKGKNDCKGKGGCNTNKPS